MVNTQEPSTTTAAPPRRSRRGPLLVGVGAGLAVLGIIGASILGAGADGGPTPSMPAATTTVPAGSETYPGQDLAGEGELPRFDPDLLLPANGDHPDSVLPVDLSDTVRLADPLPTLPTVVGAPLDLRTLVADPGQVTQVWVDGGGLAQDSALLAHQARGLLDVSDPTLHDVLIAEDEMGDAEDFLDAAVAVRARTEAGWLPVTTEPVTTWTLPLRAGDTHDAGCLSTLAANVEYAGMESEILATCVSTLVPAGDPASVAVPYAGWFGTTVQVDGDGWQATLARERASSPDTLLVWADEGAAAEASITVSIYALTLQPELTLGAGG